MADDAFFSGNIGDECSADGGDVCALNALQLRGESAADAAAATAAHVEAVVADEARHAAASQVATEAAAETAAESLRSLLAPRLRYNSSAFGGRRAPAVATQYDGLEDMRAFQHADDGTGMVHVFAIGDWGALMPNHRTAPNKRGRGRQCPWNCGYVYGVDDRAQLLVAAAMKQRAVTSKPQYVLNVGDNFYWSGVPEGCTSAHATAKTHDYFSNGWSAIYGGLASKPWISTLGNHDYGGFQFNHGWPQQIGYSFVNRNWVMPARFFSRKMSHAGFTVEYFVIDSNAFDAKEPDDDPNHNLCSRRHNPPGATCAVGNGPSSVWACKNWFWDTYRQQKQWLQGKLSDSSADWQVVVTHFPCGHDAGFYRMLHGRYGLDLLVTGHRHDQELWSDSGALGGLTCFVTGGGGGVTSEHPPIPSRGSSQYGFFDLTISKEKLKVELVAINGNVLKSSWVYPTLRQ